MPRSSIPVQTLGGGRLEARAPALPDPIAGMKAMGAGIVDPLGIATGDIQDADPLASGVGSLLSAGPALKAAKGLVNAAGQFPKLSTILMGGSAATAGASEAGKGSESPVQGLLVDRAAKVRQRDDAVAEAKKQEKTGRGPKWEAAMSEVTRLENEVSALDGMISDIRRENSPERLMEIQQMQQQAAEEEQRKRAQTPMRELYSDATKFLPALSVGAGLTMGSLLRGRGGRVFNETLEALNKRWEDAVKAGHDAMAKGNRVKAQRFADEATSLKAEFEAAKAAGPKGTGSAVAAGAGTGVMTQFLPEEIDLARAPAGSDLQKKTYEALFGDPWATAERGVLGAILGGVPAFEGAKLIGARRDGTPPTGFGPETTSLSKMLKRRAETTATKSPPRLTAGGTPAKPLALPSGQNMSSQMQSGTAGRAQAASSGQSSGPVSTPYGLRDPATGRFTKKN